MEEQKNTTQEQTTVPSDLLVTSAVHFELERNDRRYHFYMPIGAPLGEAYDACFEVLQRMHQLSAHAMKQAENVKSDGNEVELSKDKVTLKVNDAPAQGSAKGA